MTTLKTAQDSLSKALDHQKKGIMLSKIDVAERFAVAEPETELSSREMEQVIQTVRNECNLEELEKEAKVVYEDKNEYNLDRC